MCQREEASPAPCLELGLHAQAPPAGPQLLGRENLHAKEPMLRLYWNALDKICLFNKLLF